MKKSYYQIDGVNEKFRTLYNAKHHVYIAYTPNERIRELYGTCITQVKKDEVISMTPVRIDENGGYSFGRTVRP